MKTPLYQNAVLLVFRLTIFGVTFSPFAESHAQGIASRMEARIDEVQTQYDLSGDGVLTIMMDRGIDYTHPDFIDENGETRIAYIFDLYNNEGANDPDNPYGLGTIYDRQEINASLQSGGARLTNDLFGHGTATTGIMCGNGSAIVDSELYRGVAYKSTIISIVVTKDFVPPFGTSPGQSGQYNPTLLPAAFQFATDKIAELNLPSVTLLNIGSVGDPTDGSLSICETIDAYVAAGNTFLCGVGDDGGVDNHAVKTLATGTTTEFIIEKGEVGNLRFTAWYAENDRVSLSIERPDGVVEGPFDPPNGPNVSADVALGPQGIFIFHRGADVEFAESNNPNLRQLLIDFSGSTGTYKVILESEEVNSSGIINGYLNPALYFNTNRFGNNDQPGGNINSFSSCLNTLSPGDYVATSNWVDIDNISRSRVGEGAPGEIWIGSSTGPTMDDRLGIDMVAPGEIAAAAYSLDSYYGSFPFNVLQNSDGYYGVQTAVSAAAPITAGVIALMLEVNGGLSPDEIKGILQETARSDSFTGAVPNTIWGYGKLDALAAVNRVIQLTNTDDVVAVEYPVELFPNPFIGPLNIKTTINASPFDEIKVFDLKGVCHYQAPFKDQATLELAHLPVGIYVLSLKSSTISRSFKLVKTE